MIMENWLPEKQKPWLVVLADFPGVTIPTITNFELQTA